MNLIGHLFAYSLSSGIIMLALYLIYKWIMANENQHLYNRGVLLGIYIVSMAALPLWATCSRLFAHAAPMAMQRATAVMATDLDINAFIAVQEPEWPVMRVILWIYLAGMVGVAMHTLIIAVRLYGIISRGEHVRHGRFTLVVIDRPTRLAPFSWGRYMVMARSDYESAGEIIATHEEQHLRSRHWLDLLAAQAVAMLCWYNPAAWLIREELKAVHEYEADKRVLNQGVDARQYQILLVKKAVGARFPSLANSLNHSKLKKRITMMNSKKSGPARRLRALALVPALAGAMFVTRMPVIASVIDDGRNTSLTSERKDNENLAPAQAVALTLLLPPVTGEDSGEVTVATVTPTAELPETAGEIAEIKVAEVPDDETSIPTDTVDLSQVRIGTKHVPFNLYIDGEPAVTNDLTQIAVDRIESITISKETEPYSMYVKLKAADAPQPEFLFSGLDNIDGTNITIIANNVSTLSISEAVYVNGDKTYQAKSISTSLSDGTATIKLRFKTLHKFHDDASVVLTTNLGKITLSAK